MPTCETKLGQILFVLLLSSNVIFIAARRYKPLNYAASKIPKLLKYRLSDHAVPHHYNIKLEIHPFDPNVIGTSVITVQIRYRTNLISLHFEGNILNVTLKDQFDLSRKSQQVYINRINGTKDIYFEDWLSPGTYTFYINHHARPPRDTSMLKLPPCLTRVCLLWKYMATAFLPIGARYLFPCWDEPGIKSTFEMSIMFPTQFNNYTIYTNVPSTQTYEERGIVFKWRDFVTTQFQRTPKMSTYHIAIAVVPKKLSSLTFNTEMSNIRFRKHNLTGDMQRANFITDLVTEILTSYVNFKTDFKTNQIIIPNIHKESVANWGLIVYRESAIMYHKKIDPVAQKLEVNRLIISSVANAWFGYFISPSWWPYIWLQEGFAIFFQTKVSIMRQVKKLLIVQIRHESLQLDVTSDMKALENDESPELIVLSPFSLYVKAPAILYMLENIVTPEVFQNGITQYMRQYMFGSATSDDLWNEIQIALNNSGKHPDYMVKDVMHTWVKQRNYPVIEVKRNEDHEIIICLQHFNESGNNQYSMNRSWWIPVTYTVQTKHDFINTVPQTWLTPETSCVTLDPIPKRDWIIVNIQQSGYYRVNYDETNWRYIASYLNSENYRKIPVLNRAQIIDDAFHFMITRKLDRNIFLDLMNYLSKEVDYVAWYPMLKIFEYLSGYLPFQESDFIKERMLTILTGVIKTVEYTENLYESDITKCLRMEVVKWLCILGNSHCIKEAELKLERQFKQLEQGGNRITPGWKDWMYCNGLIKAELNTWNKMLYHIQKANEPQQRIFEYLSCIRNPTILNICIQYIMHKETLESNKRIDIFYSIVAKNAENNLDTVLDAYNDIFKKYTRNDKIKALSILINHVYSIDTLSKIREYAKNNLHSKPIIEEIKHMLQVRWKHIHHSLNKFFKWFESIPERPNIYVPVKEPDLHEETNITKTKLEYHHYRLPSNVKPIHYSINLSIPEYEKDNFTIEGICNIIINVTEERENIMLHSADVTSLLNIDELSFTDANIQQTNPDKTSNNQTVYYCDRVYNSKTEILTLKFKTALAPGYYNLSIKFTNIIPNYEEAIFRSYIDENGSKLSVAVTDLRLIGARKIFPCWDEPAMKAEFVISIMHHFDYTVFLNKPGQTNIYIHKDYDKALTTFNTSFVASTNSLMMIMVPKFDYILHINRYNKRQYVCRPHMVEHMQRICNITQDVQTYFENVTMSKQILLNMVHIAIPKFHDKIIGHIGLTVYNEGSIIYDEQTDSIGRKIEISRLIAYTMSQVWFNDLATPLWWTDLWLSDGAAKLLAAHAIKKINPQWRTDELFTMQLQHESLHFDINYNTHAIGGNLNSSAEIKSLHSFYFFIKAPVITRMLQYITIPSCFFNSFSAFFNNQFQRITLSTFLRSIQDKAFEVFLRSHDVQMASFDYIAIKNKLDNWITKPHYPILKVTRDDRTVIISQENINVLDQTLWWIPITYTTQRKLEFSNTTTHYWLQPHKKEVVLTETYEKNEWIIVNLKQTGYYRVKYDTKNWQLIADYLHSEKYKNIHVLNRAQLIDDAYHFMMTKQIDSDIFFNLTSYLSRETDYVAWYPMIKIFEYLSGFLPYRKSIPLKNHMLNILNGVLEKIGYEENPKDDDLIKCLRQEAAKWACILDDPHCKVIANMKLRKYLKNPENNKLLPGWKEWTYCNGLKTADVIIFNEMWHLHMKTFNYTIFGSPCSTDFIIPYFLREHIELSKTSKLQHKNRINILYYIVTRIDRHHFDSTLKNFEEYIFYYATDLSEKRKILAIIINYIYSETQLYKVMKHLQDNKWDNQTVAGINHLINARRYHIEQHKTSFHI